MKIYVSGPMRGKPDFNFPAFIHAANLLRLEGHEVVDPAQTSLDYARAVGRPLEHIPFHEFMRVIDIPVLTQVEAICVLEGWEHSVGARIEVLTAWAMGLSIFRFDDRSDVIIKDFSVTI